MRTTQRDREQFELDQRKSKPAQTKWAEAERAKKANIDNPRPYDDVKIDPWGIDKD